MKSKLKGLNWGLVIVMAIVTWYLVQKTTLIPEFLMVQIRQTEIGSVLIPYFIYAWIIYAVYFFKGKTMEKVTIHAVVTTIAGVGAYYLYDWIKPWLSTIF